MLNQIPLTDFDPFLDSLDYYMRDKAVLGSLKARYPQLVEISRAIMESEQRMAALTPFPTIDQFTAVQCAVFDNWRDGRKAKLSQHVLALEIWTAPAGQIQTHKRNNFQAKANIQLCGPKAMAKKVKELKGLPAEFIAPLRDVVAIMKPEDLAGIVMTKRPGEGSKYHPLAAIVLGGVQGEKTGVLLFEGVGVLRLPAFSATQPDGETRHGGNVVLQSRCDLSGFSVNWATGEGAFS